MGARVRPFNFLLILALICCQGLAAVSINDAIAGIGDNTVIVVWGASAHADDEAAAKALETGLRAAGFDAISSADDQVKPWTRQNAHIIVVGGPAVNSFARELKLTKWDFCAGRTWPCAEPRAVVRAYKNRLSPNRYAIVVAGWGREQTALCADLLARFKEHMTELAAHAVDVKATTAMTLIPATDHRVMLVTPDTLYAGGSAAATVTVTDEKGSPVPDTPITLLLLNKDDEPPSMVYEGKTGADGHVLAPFAVPEVPEGGYRLIIESGPDHLTGDVSIKVGRLLFIETDKPIYKPGQTIHGRVLVLDAELRPVSAPLEVSVQDAKGIKVYKKVDTSSGWGSLSFDLPLATELNLGTWKVTATSGDAEATVDVRVEKYVLPKFKIEVDMEKEWVLVDEKVKGSVSANYFFGKPVKGTAEIVASVYRGVWEEYATYTAELDDEGNAEFDLAAVGFAAGTVGAGGAGSLMLNVTVTDTGDHEEKESRLLKVVESPLVIQLIAESPTIKPGLPFDLLVVTKSPDGIPVDAEVGLSVAFSDDMWSDGTSTERTVETKNGMALATYTPPNSTQKGSVSAAAQGTTASLDLTVAYSPSSSFIHLAQKTRGVIGVGTLFEAEAHATFPGTTFYDVVAGGRTVFSGASDGNAISFAVTPAMAPSAKIVAYRINPDSEVAADTLPFDVELKLPVDLQADFDKEEAAPGDTVTVSFDAQRRSEIGFAIVDESVFALSEGRLNLRQVFDELERRFMEPSAEAHPKPDVNRWGPSYKPPQGAWETLEGAGLMVLASDDLVVPRSQQADIGWGRPMAPGGFFDDAMGFEVADMAFDAQPKRMMAAAPMEPEMKGMKEESGGQELAEVERVRQFFPETWMWVPDLETAEDGTATMSLSVPDSITTWRLHAVSSSSAGLGIAEGSLKVFQEFFADPDLPYAVIRGEEFPVKVQVYNYLGVPQKVQVTLEGGDWYDLVSGADEEVEVEPSGVRSVTYVIRPTKVGTRKVRITARGPNKADAVVKTLIVDPEGTRRESVENAMLSAGQRTDVDVSMPDDLVPDSDKVLVHVTPSLAAQAISGVENLLTLPTGCGEQTMIRMAPNTEMLRYLKQTDQLTPEIRAKSEFLMQTGYQRELTFQRTDGSFSAFGNSDSEGSLWLTAFVLMTFSGARELMTIDEGMMDRTADWIVGHQATDGSWAPVGFLCHKDLSGGLSGTFGLTAYTVLALSDYDRAPSGVLDKARSYLETELDSAKGDAYALSIAGLALNRLGSPEAEQAADMVLDLAEVGEKGTSFGSPVIEGKDLHVQPATVAVETASYAAILLMELKRPEAAGIVKWIHSQRNSRGGYGSTQDTVMAFKTLMLAARAQTREVDLSVRVLADGTEVAALKVGQDNFDVLQTVEVPSGTATVSLVGDGSGEVSTQVVSIWHEPALPEGAPTPDLDLQVTYDTADVAVSALIDVDVSVTYHGAGSSTGMLLVDVAVPTGFAANPGSLDSLVEDGTIMRFETAGRKIVLYIDDLPRDKELALSFKMMSLFPVKAKIPVSKAYAYYDPAITAESAAGEVTVVG